MPRLSSSAIYASRVALGAILSIWRNSPLGGFHTYRWRLRHLIFQQHRYATPPGGLATLSLGATALAWREPTLEVLVAIIGVFVSTAGFAAIVGGV